MSAPPAAGPATAENWNVLEDQFKASGKSGRATNCGRNEALADHRKVRATPATNRQMNIHTTGSCFHEMKARPMDVQARTACMAMMTFLRSRVSATCPAGSVIRTMGTNAVRPTKPSSKEEWVRS